MRICRTRSGPRWLRSSAPLAFPLAVTACGGSGGAGDGNSGTLQPFTFRWVAVVTAIEDGNSAPAGIPGVAVGDTVVATVDYDPAQFGPGVNVSGDGLDHAAVVGSPMLYAFPSGTLFAKVVRGVRARDGGAFDQWNWSGGDFGGLLFQVNDPGDASFTLPLSADFSDVHSQFGATIAAFQTSSASLDFPDPDPAIERRISMDVTSFQLIVN